MLRNAVIFLIISLCTTLPANAAINWSNTIVVIIGNSEYGRDTVPNLPFAENDVTAMEEFVRNGLGVSKNNIRIERNAGRNTFLDIFGEGRWLDQQVQRTKANVIVYISSHGVPDTERNAYFVPYNANPSFPEELFPRSRVVDALERAKRFQDGRDRRVLALFDSCFSGSSAQGAVLPGKTGLPSMDIEQDDEEVTIFSAVSSEGIAYPDDDAQMSALTSAFLQGIAGAADNPSEGGNDDASVSLVELSDYLQRSVPLLSKRNQIPDIKPGEEFGFEPFALEALKPQLLAKQAKNRWEALDLDELKTSVLGRDIDELQPRRRYLRMLNSKAQRLKRWCRKQPANVCKPFAAELSELPEQIKGGWRVLEDELAWRAAEDPKTFALDCDAYKKSCAQLQATFPGYRCLHAEDLKWQCPSDDVPLLSTARERSTLEAWTAYVDECIDCDAKTEAEAAIAALKDEAAWKQAQSVNTLSALRDYADGCAPRCAHKDAALKQIAAFELAARQERLRREDDVAWAKVRSATSAATIQNSYLDKCNELCRHADSAKAKIDELEKAAAKRAKIALREEDERFWSITAKGSNLISAYRVYLNGCNEICKYRDVAEKRISEIATEKAQDTAALRKEDRLAWQKLRFSTDASRIQSEYLDRCNEICAYKSQAEERIAKINGGAKAYQSGAAKDFENWQRAVSIDSVPGYERYIRNCGTQCAYKIDAWKNIEKIKKRYSDADFQAWLAVKFASSASVVRNRYLDHCRDTVCKYEDEAIALVNKINKNEAARIGRLSSSNKTKMLQRVLNRYGCDAGTVDGILGAGTKAAYKRFATINRLSIQDVVSLNIGNALADITVWNARDYKGCDGKEPTTSAKSSTGETFRDCPECPLLVKIPSGSFMMGSNVEGNNAKPAHSVRIRKGFAIGVYEVSYGEWRACIDEGYCKSQVSPISYGDKLKQPMAWVSWDNINAPHRKGFVTWLNSKVPGSPYRLPSEAEWEYAARAGSTSKWWWGYTIPKCSLPGLTESAVFKKCGINGSKMVGSFSSPNRFGLYDVHGNVSEWVEDCYFPNYHSAPTDETARKKSDCKRRVARGGSWDDSYGWTSSTTRLSVPASTRSAKIGFRIARDL